MNRVLPYLDDSPCCKWCEAERRQARVAGEMLAIEQLTGTELFEFLCPRLADFADRPPHEVEIGLFLKDQLDTCPADADLREHVARELRRLGTRLLEAAERLEGGA